MAVKHLLLQYDRATSRRNIRRQETGNGEAPAVGESRDNRGGLRGRPSPSRTPRRAHAGIEVCQPTLRKRRARLPRANVPNDLNETNAPNEVIEPSGRNFPIAVHGPNARREPTGRAFRIRTAAGISAHDSAGRVHLQISRAEPDPACTAERERKSRRRRFRTSRPSQSPKFSQTMSRSLLRLPLPLRKRSRMKRFQRRLSRLQADEASSDWDREQQRLHQMNVAAVFGGEAAEDDR